MAGEEWPCTADDLIRLRVEQGLSWKDVAVELGLGEGKAQRGRYAQHAWEDLTGSHRSEAKPQASGSAPKRSNRENGSTPTRKPPARRTRRLKWNDETEQDEIEAVLMGEEHRDDKGRTKWRCRKVTVERTLYGATDTVTLDVRYATAFTFGPNDDQPLQVEVVEELRAGDYIGARCRILFAHKIVSVK